MDSLCPCRTYLLGNVIIIKVTHSLERWFSTPKLKNIEGKWAAWAITGLKRPAVEIWEDQVIGAVTIAGAINLRIQNHLVAIIWR